MNTPSGVVTQPAGAATSAALSTCYNEFSAAFDNALPDSLPAPPNPFQDPYKRAHELADYMYTATPPTHPRQPSIPSLLPPPSKQP